LAKIALDKDISIVCSSLKKTNFGDTDIYFPHWTRGIVTMFNQILGALENTTADVVYFCEHDVLYHPTHFDFVPERDDLYYYNDYFWKTDIKSGKAIRHYCRQLSGLCGYRDILLAHYKKRVGNCRENVRLLAEEGKVSLTNGYSMSMGYEPGKNVKGRIDSIRAVSWRSEFPNIDIRHGHNLTKNYFKKTDERNKESNQGYLIADEIPGWGKVKYLIT
jgi:hypothetical protein